MTLSDFAAIQENYQQELESLLSVDDAMGRRAGALRPQRRAREHAVHLHVRQRLLPRRAPYRSRRCCPTGPPPTCRWSCAGPACRAASASASSWPMWTWRPPSWRRRPAAPGRLQDGRSLLRLLRDPTLELGREFVHENGAGVNGVPPYRALRNDRFLYVRHDTTGEYGALRPAQGPLRAAPAVDESDEYAGSQPCALAPAARAAALRRRGVLHPRYPRSGCRRASSGRRTEPNSHRTTPRPDLRAPRRPAGDHGCGRASGWSRSATRSGAGAWARRAAVPFLVKVKRRSLPSGRRISVRARVSARDGRVVTVDRSS